MTFDGSDLGEEPKFKYKGEWKRGLKDGPGSCSWPQSGHSFEGTFEKEVREGPGTCFWNDGSSWSGIFADDLMHGAAILTLPGEESQSEVWHMGHIVQRGGKQVRVKAPDDSSEEGEGG